MIPENPALDVIIVAYGSPDALARALTSLEGGFSVLVVDNSSSPEIAAVARVAGARYVDPGANLGFGAAVNVALDHLDDPDRNVLLLNPDARITPAELQRLYDALLSHPDLACVAPAQHVPGSSAPSRARWPWHTPGGAWAEALGFSRRRLRSSRYFIGGAVLLLRKKALADVGAFDERFFLYSEDEDWQRRARDQGWRVRFCPEIVAQHAAGGSETNALRLELRLHAAIERYIRKWYGPWGWALYRSGTIFGLLLRVAARHGDRRRAAARLTRLYLTGPDRTARRTGAVPGG